MDAYEAKTTLDGSRKHVTSGYGAGQQYTLLPGDYVAIGSKDQARAEVAFTVKPGERMDVKLVLDAGVLAMEAPAPARLRSFTPRMICKATRNPWPSAMARPRKPPFRPAITSSRQKWKACSKPPCDGCGWLTHGIRPALTADCPKSAALPA